jgi:hypothetical protein
MMIGFITTATTTTTTYEGLHEVPTVQEDEYDSEAAARTTASRFSPLSYQASYSQRAKKKKK